MGNQDSNADVLLALDEMRTSWQHTYTTSDALDQKASFLLTAAGIIIALVAALSLDLAKVATSPVKLILLLIALGLYVVMIVMAILTLLPALYSGPIKPDWGALNEFVFNKSERDAVLSMLSGYINVIEGNKASNDRKAKFVQFGLIMFTIVLLLMIAAVIFP